MDNCLAQFHANNKALRWDEDLVEYYREASEWSEETQDWKALLSELNKSVSSLAESWRLKWKETPKPEWEPTVEEFFEVYESIQPNDNNPLARALNPTSLKAEGTQWALLRASALFYSYSGSKESMSFFPWWMAGRELIRLKANSKSAPGGVPHTVIAPLYVTKKPNITFVKRLRCEQAICCDNDDDRIENDEFKPEEGG